MIVVRADKQFRIASGTSSIPPFTAMLSAEISAGLSFSARPAMVVRALLNMAVTAFRDEMPRMADYQP